MLDQTPKRPSLFHPNNLIPPPQPQQPAIPVKGLYNPFGANNCFVNVVIQILWNLDAFRNVFMSINDGDHHHKDVRSCVFCALKNLFTHYAFSEQTCLVPEEIRRTLSIAYEAT